MGYSIMTPFENERVRQQMLGFLGKNFRSPNELTGMTCYEYTSEPRTDVSYDSEEELFVIGFDYHGSGLGREYPYLICSWMAMMNGKRKDFGEIKDCPYIIYDGNEDIALVRHNLTSLDCQVVDENGFWPIKSTEFNREEQPKADALNLLVQNELKRLSKLYQKK